MQYSDVELASLIVWLRPRLLVLVDINLGVEPRSLFFNGGRLLEQQFPKRLINKPQC